MKKIPILTSLMFVPALLIGQSGLDPADMLKPLKDQWTSYSGDLTGKRYSALKLINNNTAKNLSLKWVASNITTGCGATGTAPAAAGGIGRGGGPGAPAAPAPIIVGGLGTGQANTPRPPRPAAGIRVVAGIIYALSPAN